MRARPSKIIPASVFILSKPVPHNLEPSLDEWLPNLLWSLIEIFQSCRTVLRKTLGFRHLSDLLPRSGTLVSNVTGSHLKSSADPPRRAVAIAVGFFGRRRRRRKGPWRTALFQLIAGPASRVESVPACATPRQESFRQSPGSGCTDHQPPSGFAYKY